MLRDFEQTAPPSLREGTPPNLGGDWESITANRYNSHTTKPESLKARLQPDSQSASAAILIWNGVLRIIPVTIAENL